MKKLNTSDIDLSSAFCVAESQSKNRLLRFELDSYALVDPWHEGVIFAFKSFDFSMILNSLSGIIRDFAVLGFSFLSENTDEDMFEVRVMDDAGSAYSVDSYGVITELQALELVDAFGDDVISPINEWKLDSVSPIDRILISRHLAFQLSTYLQSDRKKFLSRLWMEFERIQDAADASKKTHYFQCEFGSFSADELVCGRVLFNTSRSGIFVAETDV